MLSNNRPSINSNFGEKLRSFVPTLGGSNVAVETKAKDALRAAAASGTPGIVARIYFPTAVRGLSQDTTTQTNPAGMIGRIYAGAAYNPTPGAPRDSLQKIGRWFTHGEYK